MKTVVIGESSGATMETIMTVYPRHKAIVDKYIARGEVIGIGPFSDRGNMAIFKTREAAEQFVTEDPFILEGLVKSYAIREWNDNLLPG
ncbi:MAG TPA: YciI family protein [Hanamia sp.]|nr:YciI family protein [Hanamia sp.]